MNDREKDAKAAAAVRSAVRTAISPGSEMVRSESDDILFIGSQISRGRFFSRPRYSGGGQGRGFGR
jgi:hypothetical protein